MTLLFFILLGTGGSYLISYLQNVYGVMDSVVFEEQDVIRFSKFKGDEEITVDSVADYRSYVKKSQWGALLRGYFSVKAESTQVSESRPVSSGLIPTIQIPINLPRSLSFLGSNQSTINLNGLQTVSLNFEKNVNYDPQSYVGLRSSYFNPQLEQQLRLNLEGTIGTKLKILIDHDSQRQDETKNKVVVKFEGEEDDVVKLIEFGDTRVSLPSTRFASFPGQSKEGLFGLNTQFQLGPLKLQGILTREKGESQSTSLSRGAVQDSLILYGRDFEKFRFFYIPEAESIVSLQVFIDEQRGYQQGVTVRGFAYYYGYDMATQSFRPDTSLKEYGNFKVLTQGTDYYFYPSSGILELFKEAGENYVIAVSYKTSSGREVGRLVQDTSLHIEVDSLRLVKPSTFPLYVDSLQSRTDSLKANLWNLMLMNIYDIRASSIALENLDIQIGRDSSGVIIWGENGRSFLNILGLDRNNDGKVDLYYSEGGRVYDILDLNKGLLIFPMPKPFMFDSLQVRDSLIYRKTRLSYSEGITYIIKVVKRQISRTIYLNQMNILEGSEVVRYNGRQLTRGKDYEINYDTGELTILNESILKDPDAKIDVSFDYAPLFSLKDKYLWGARWEWPISTSLKIGGSIMGRSESSPQKRPTIGSEPTMSLVSEVDFNFDSQLPVLSDIFSRISFNKQKTPSSLRIQGEVARSYPNPNTKGFAYLDDMENSKDEMDVSFSLHGWKRSSIPLVSSNVEKDTFYLGRKIVWVGVTDLYKKGQIFTNIPEEDKNLPYTVFYIELYPKEQGIPSYLGITTLLSSLGQDFTNYEYLNLIVKGGKGKLVIDVGPDISENGVWRDRAGRIRSYDPYTVSTEDKNNNGALDEGEDTGLDGVSGADSVWNAGSMDEGDDDYYFPKSGERNYSRVNGTERNGRLDTEELIVDGKLSLDNNYFEYVIDLENPPQNLLIGENQEGFRTFLIPLKDTLLYKKFGNPNWGYIRFVRVWFDSIAEPETVIVAQLKFQGNKYVKSRVFTADTTVPVTSEEFIGVRSVGSTDDPSYTSPPGIELERDLLTGQLEQENSLGLKYGNIRPTHYAHVTQTKPQPLNFMDYRDIRFFVRPRPDVNPPYPTLFIRLGDSLNYYEYRFKITENAWKEVIIPIDSLTQIKKAIRDSVATPGPHFVGNIGIMGNPSFTQVKSIVFGILNDESLPISGEVWIDELRLGDPRRDVANAYQLNMDLRWANFLTFSFSTSRLQSNFKPLAGMGSKSDDKNYAYSTGIDLGALLPREWNVRLALNHMGTRSASLPLYGAYSDLLLKLQQQREQMSYSRSERTSFSFSKSSGSKNVFVRYLIEPLTLSGFMNRDEGKTPRNERFYSGRNLSVSHGIRIPFTFKFKKIVISPIPEYRFSGSYTNALSINRDFLSNINLRDSSRTFDQTHTISFRPIGNFGNTYTLGRTYDYWRKLETGYSEGFNSNLGFSIWRLFDPVNVSYQANYRENKDLSALSLDSTVTSNASAGTNVSCNVNLNYNFAFERLLSFVFRPTVDSAGKVKENARLKSIKGFLSNFQPLRFSYTISDNYGIYRFSHRPDWRFRLGIDRKLLSDSGSVERFTNTFTRNYNFGSGLRIFNAVISLDASYSNTVNTVYISKRYTKSITWPRITLSNMRLTHKWLTKYFTNLGIGFSYQKMTQNSGNFGSSPDNMAINTSFSPSLDFITKVGVGGRLSYTLNNSENKDLRFGERITKNSERRLGLNGNYTVPMGKVIKLPGKSLKLKSSLQLSTNLQWSRSVQSAVLSGRETKLRDQTTYSWDMSASYSVTNNITGVASFGYRRYLDNLSKRYNSTTNFGVNVNFNF